MQKYPFIKDFVKTDCADGTGIDHLRQILVREVDRLENLRDPFPTSWFTIKHKLSRLDKNYLSFSEFRALCHQDGEQDEQAQELLASYLHNLGIALNYRDDPRLQEMHILNPHWVTNGIYKILNAPELKNQKGVLNLNNTNSILDPREYPFYMRRFILDLMKKFELCFSFPEDDCRYLIPELLTKEEPLEAGAFEEECLQFQYHYPILPEGLLPRFIVRTNVLSEGLHRWRTGVILKFEDNYALVKADVQDKKVFIKVNGQMTGRRRLLAIIRSDFERIHFDIRHLKPLEMVPLPEFPKVVIPYQKLLVMEDKGVKSFIEVVDSNIIEVETLSLLNGVDIEYTYRKDLSMKKVSEAVRLFYSYSHKDETLRNELETHLKLLQRQGLISTWHDRQIEAGEEWKQKIDENLDRADIILLLISADFIASDYCWDKEMKRALERHEKREAVVVPVILRDVSWGSAPFAKLPALPKDALAITKWGDKDSAWRNVAEGIEKTIIKVRRGIKNNAVETLAITGISLSNIRCFENIDLSFVTPAGFNNFILFFGNNGTGKTTLLRSIALGLCDPTTTSGLMEMLPGSLLREKEGIGKIKIELSDYSNRNWSIETILRRDSNGLVSIEQNVSDNFPRSKIFACAYGASRRGFGSNDYEDYSLRNSLLTLFDYDSSLQNPELALRRIQAQGYNINDITERIDSVLMLETGSTRIGIDSTGIRIKGPWGDFMPLGGLGDGFQATLGWIADMCGWSLFYQPLSFIKGLSGIVLIDEVEQHLHPSWQREIIKLLHQQFPNIQFIVTSHAPMCALGTTALPEHASSIVALYQANESVEAVKYDAPFNQRADQVLTSPLFGLFSASGFDVTSNIQRYAYLASKDSLNNDEKKELDFLKNHLESVLEPFQNKYEREIYYTVRETLKDKLSEELQSGKITSQELDYRIIHQLKK